MKRRINAKRCCLPSSVNRSARPKSPQAPIDDNRNGNEPPSSSSPPIPARRRGGLSPLTCLGSTELNVSPMAPAVSGLVRRMRWTHQINENVMRAYYRATEGGTNLTAYRDKMFSLFQTLEPDIMTTAQRISDQVRFIQRRNILDEVTLERLRDTELPIHEVLESQNRAPSSISHPEETPMSATDNDEAVDQVNIKVSNQNIEQMRRALESTISEYRSSPMKTRPRLPRLPMHRQNLALMGTMDSILPSFLESSHNLYDTNSILYCAAVTVCRMARVKFPNSTLASRTTNHTPKWQLRIERRIQKTRVLIGKLISFRSGNNRPRIMRFVTQAFSGTDIIPNHYLDCVTERIDYLKQKVYAWANRIRRYRERVNRYQINRVFQSDQKSVYRGWKQPESYINDRTEPSREENNSFWKSIWSQPVNHDEGKWIETVNKTCDTIKEMSEFKICTLDVVSAIRPTHNWKSPGPDGLHNFWIKWFKSSHVLLAEQFQNALSSGLLPSFMTAGVTHLIYKSGSTTDPQNYRPITCLPTMYKLLTSIIKVKIYDHLITNNIMSWTQNGCKAGSRGTKELLLIDMTVCQQVKRNRRNLFTAWIDYKKAYDSLPQTWLIRVLKLYKINKNVCNLLSFCMGQWNTVLTQPGCEVLSGTEEQIRIERGIFQGDSLSPLWFCLALNPLSILMEESGLGYKFRREGKTISHLLYMDDLKMFASKEADLMKLLKITEEFSSSIRMDFGINKCAVLHVKRGKVVKSDGISLSDRINLNSLSETETYKYLGISESLGIDYKDLKQSVIESFFGRLTKVLKSLLSGGNKVRAINGWVIPILTYTFGILKWTQTDLDALDRKVRKFLLVNRMLHPRSSVMRLYIPRKCGGRGLLNAKNLHNREICNLRDYFLKSNVGVHKELAMVDKNFTPLSLANENWRKPQVLSIQDRMDIWKSKELHGRFYKNLMGPNVDLTASISWLRFGNLFGETEGFVFAIMDEVVKTNNYRKYIMKDGTVDICRACHRPGESLRHIVSGCGRLANGEYLHRHNQVAKIIHQQIALGYGLVDSEVPYYQYVPQAVLENGRAKLYWDRPIITDRNINANRPDIVIVDRSTRRATLVDITIPHDENLMKAETDKLTKYIDLAHEITNMWDVDSTIVVPIVVSTSGLMAKSLNKHLNRLSLGSWIKGQIQKAVLLETARIVRRFLTLEP